MEVWIAVTKDKYELPIAVAESRRELAEICGVTPQTVSASASKYVRRPGERFCQYRKVIVDDD